MALTPDEMTRLQAWVQEVGVAIGWDLQFTVGQGGPDVVAVTATTDLGDDGPRPIVVLGPGPASGVVHDLEALERGEKVLVIDEDGDPLLR